MRNTTVAQKLSSLTTASIVHKRVAHCQANFYAIFLDENLGFFDRLNRLNNQN